MFLLGGAVVRVLSWVLLTLVVGHFHYKDNRNTIWNHVYNISVLETRQESNEMARIGVSVIRRSGLRRNGRMGVCVVV